MKTKEIIADVVNKRDEILIRSFSDPSLFHVCETFMSNLAELGRRMGRDGIRQEKSFLFHLVSGSTPGENTLYNLDHPAYYSVREFVNRQHFDLVTQPETGTIDYQI